MIWNRLKKNRLITLSLLGLFSLFFSFFFASRTWAYSTDLNNIFFQNYYNWGNTTSGGTYNSNRRYGYYPNFANLLSPQWQYNLDYVTPYDSPQAPFAITFTTNGMQIYDNAMSFHGELNLVASNMGQNMRYYAFMNDVLPQLKVKSCANRAIASQSVTYALTPWGTTLQSGTDIRYFSNETLTLYIDITLTSLDVGTTDYLACTIGTDDNRYFMAYNYPYRWYLYAEKFDTNYLFFNTPNEALQQTQINILNNTYQLQQSIYDQDQQDRSSIQDASDDATADGNNASANAETATSNLLGAITTIYGSLLSPTQTNCVLNGVQIYQLDLGNLDFCTGFDIPPALFAIGALIMVGLIILLAWSILKAAMGLYNDLLGGKG